MPAATFLPNARTRGARPPLARRGLSDQLRAMSLPRVVRSALPGLAVLCIAPAYAQERPQSGLVEAALLLRQVDGAKRVLMIGAHPDDENSALLATLARGMGAETAYLSLTRGDGGQNLIGPELMEELGIVRTGELLAARAIDGGAQFFTRAVDYGFSKSAEEAFLHWPREELLSDVVWVIRRFRPQVIVSVFSGTPADGHGQHQATGILAREAFRAASDPARFPEQLAHVTPWQPVKLLRNVRREPAGTPATVIETGVFDPVLGRSWYQVAMEGRSQHRSQDMGAPQPPGPRATSLVLVDAVRELAPGSPLFAGVDTSLAAIAGQLPAADRARAAPEIDAYRAAIREAEGLLGVSDPGRAVPALARALGHLEALAQLAGPPRLENPALPMGRGGTEFGRVIAHHTEVAQRAVLAAAGIVVDARTGDALLVPGEETTLTVSVWNGGRYQVVLARPQTIASAGWQVSGLTAAPDGRGGPPPADPNGTGIEPGQLATWTFRVQLPADTPPSVPYFMRLPREGDLYRWPDDPEVRALPIDPPPLQAGAVLELVVEEGAEPTRIGVFREAPFVGVAQASGEFREPVLVVPAVSVAVDQPTMAWPLGDPLPRRVVVRLRGEAERGVRGTVRLEVPAGWSVAPAAAPFAFTGAGEATSAAFRVTPPADSNASADAAERVLVVAQAEDGRRWDRTVDIIDYPHIRRAAVLEAAEVAITRLDVQVAPGLRVGYVMGTGDGGFEALRQLGVEVELLGPEQVSAGDFAAFDAIVAGVRAYETRADLVATNARLLDFARAGGTVVVQYQQYQYAAGGFAPYPVEISRPHDRVTDEHAPVRVLEPSAPVLTAPNRIGPADWEGWVHERGLYFLGRWDERYAPVLEMADPGEAPLRGSLLIAPVGEGIYVYTGLAFFRQFPAGVPGAYRLFANLVSLN